MKFLNANRRMKTPKMSTKIHDQIFLNHTKVKNTKQQAWKKQDHYYSDGEGKDCLIK